MNNTKLSFLLKLFVSLFVIFLVVSIYLFLEIYKMKQGTNFVSTKEDIALVEKVSKIFVLPTDETPTIATVEDPNLLEDKIFFAEAQKGDKVLIYAKAKKIILYSVSQNKILEVAPINLDTISPTTNNDLAN